MSTQAPIEENRDQAFEGLGLPSGGGSDCALCGERATHRSPFVDQPTTDKWPLISWLRCLYNAPPRWTVVMRGKKKFCALHFSLARQLADNDVAERRYTQAQINGQEFLKVYAFNRSVVEETTKADAHLHYRIAQMSGAPQ